MRRSGIISLYRTTILPVLPPDDYREPITLFFELYRHNLYNTTGELGMYTWNAREYHSSSSNQKRWGSELIARLALKGNEHILDIGSGNGALTAEIAEKVPDGAVTGLDSSADMVNLARNNFPRAMHPNLSFVLQDASNLDFNEEFDIVFSNACLHWIKDHQPVLKGIQKGLKPAGRILLQMGGKGNAADLIAIMDTLIQEPKWSPYFRTFVFPYGFYSPEEYKPWLLAAGFITHRIELVEKDMIHENNEQFASWVRTTWLPYTQQVPGEMQELLITELTMRYKSLYPPDEKDAIHIRMVRLEVDAQRHT